MIMPIFLSDFSGHGTRRSQEIPHTVTGRVHDQGVDLMGGYQEQVSRGEQHQRPRQLPVGDAPPAHRESVGRARYSQPLRCGADPGRRLSLRGIFPKISFRRGSFPDVRNEYRRWD